MRSIPGQGNALETEPSFDDAACCPFESFYRANRNEKQPDYQYHCAYLPVLGICCTFDIKSDMRMVLALLTSLRSFSSFWHGIARKRSLLVLRASVDIKSTEKAATMSRVFCTFFPQKGTQKSPADACAYSVPSNVRNGRLFAGLQANRPRFLPLLAGASFHGSGIGPGSFAAKGGAGVRRLFYGCLHRTGSQYPAVAPESGFKPLYAFCRAGFSSRDIGKLSTFHF